MGPFVWIVLGIVSGCQSVTVSIQQAGSSWWLPVWIEDVAPGNTVKSMKIRSEGSPSWKQCDKTNWGPWILQGDGKDTLPLTVQIESNWDQVLLLPNAIESWGVGEAAFPQLQFVERAPQACSGKARSSCSFHGKCDGYACDCDQGWQGTICSCSPVETCNGHGVCDVFGGCACHDGFTRYTDCRAVEPTEPPTPQPSNDPERAPSPSAPSPTTDAPTTAATTADASSTTKASTTTTSNPIVKKQFGGTATFLIVMGLFLWTVVCIVVCGKVMRHQQRHNEIKLHVASGNAQKHYRVAPSIPEAEASVDV